MLSYTRVTHHSHHKCRVAYYEVLILSNYYKVEWMTQQFLKETFTYSSDGTFYWKVDRPIEHFATLRGYSVYMTQRAGVMAGKIVVNEVFIEGKKPLRDTREVVVSYKGDKKKFPTHKLVYLYHHGYVPDLIDHIDGDYLNNRLENLQELNFQLNTSKATMFSHNSSGYRGVRYRKRDNKWIVNIKVDGKGYYIGQYKDLEYAAEVYNYVSKEIFGEYVFTNQTSLPSIDPTELYGVFFDEHLPKILKEFDERYGKERKYRSTTSN